MATPTPKPTPPTSSPPHRLLSSPPNHSSHTASMTPPPIQTVRPTARATNNALSQTYHTFAAERAAPCPLAHPVLPSSPHGQQHDHIDPISPSTYTTSPMTPVSPRAELESPIVSARLEFPLPPLPVYSTATEETEIGIATTTSTATATATAAETGNNMQQTQCCTAFPSALPPRPQRKKAGMIKRLFERRGERGGHGDGDVEMGTMSGRTSVAVAAGSGHQDSDYHARHTTTSTLTTPILMPTNDPSNDPTSASTGRRYSLYRRLGLSVIAVLVSCVLLFAIVGLVLYWVKYRRKEEGGPGLVAGEDGVGESVNGVGGRYNGLGGSENGVIEVLMRTGGLGG